LKPDHPLEVDGSEVDGIVIVDGDFRDPGILRSVSVLREFLVCRIKAQNLVRTGRGDPQSSVGRDGDASGLTTQGLDRIDLRTAVLRIEPDQIIRSRNCQPNIVGLAGIGDCRWFWPAR
jgi:hypothetical protein